MTCYPSLALAVLTALPWIFGINYTGYVDSNLFSAKQAVELSADKLTLDKKEITLTKANNFSASVVVSGISNFDATQLVVSGCSDICTIEKTSGPSVVISLKSDAFFNTEEKVRTLSFSYKTTENKALTESLAVKIPPRVTKLETKVTLDGKVTNSLVVGQEAAVSVTYLLDNAETVSSAVLEPSDKDKLEAGDGKITAKQSGDTSLIVKVNQNKNSEIKKIPLKIHPAISSLEAKSGNSLYMTESSDTELKLVVKASRGQIVGVDRIKCDPDATLAPLVSLKKSPTVGFSISALPLPAGTERVSGTITCLVDNKTAQDLAANLEINTTVSKKEGSLTIESLNGNTMLPNGTLTFLATVYDAKNNETNATLRYSYEDPIADKQWVSLSQQGRKLIVSWVDFAQADPDNPKKRNPRPEFLNIRVEARLPNSNNPLVTIIPIHMTSVTRFASLKVKLNIMDDQTASDLYGSVLRDEYYVLMIRLFNDLKDKDPNKQQGDAILAYSSSIQIAVGLEKQYDKNSNSGTIATLSKDQMREIARERSEKVFEDFKKNLGVLDDTYQDLLDDFNAKIKVAFEKEEIAIQLEVEAENDASKAQDAMNARGEATAAYRVAASISDKLRGLYRLNSLSTPAIPAPGVPVTNGKWYPAGRDDLIQASFAEGDLLSDEESEEDDGAARSLRDGEPNCVDTITYKPFTFEMMVNTVDRRQERSFRSRAFKLLEGLALGTSFITAVAVPKQSSDLPLGLEKYSNLFIPGLEKLFPNMKEQYRQNIVSQTMKTIEEIPFGSDITRVVFIPKRPIRGLVAGHKVRISQVCPFFFKIKVAVVSKGGTVTVGNQRRL